MTTRAEAVRREPRSAWVNGRLVPWAEATVPLEDRGLQFGESVYEVIPVTAGTPRLLGEHLERMHRGAAALGIGEGLPSSADLAAVAATLVGEEGVGEGLLYAQLTGGAAARSHTLAGRRRPSFFAYLRPHRFPRRATVERGLRAVTVADERWARSDLKTTMLLPAVLAKREAAERGADEALLVGPGGRVREGASANLFVVVAGGLLQPRDGPHLLPGTVRAVVVRLAVGRGVRVACGPVTVRQLLTADEAFLTSTSQLVMPLVEVDGRPISSGVPGPIAVELARCLRAEFELAET